MHPHATRSRLALSVTLLAGAAITLGACSSGNSADARWKEMKGNPTSEVDSLAETHYEFHNRRAITVDTNLRAAINDWERLWLVDRPSRLSKTPAPR